MLESIDVNSTFDLSRRWAARELDAVAEVDALFAATGLGVRHMMARGRVGRTNLENPGISMGAFLACIIEARGIGGSWQNEPRKCNEFNAALSRRGKINQLLCRTRCSRFRCFP